MAIALLCALPRFAAAQIEPFDPSVLAPNDLKDEDGKEYTFSKKSRKDYEQNHKCEHKLIDQYYLNGEKEVMHDTANRARTAKRAARYLRPKCGYVEGDHHKGPKEGDCADPVYDPTTEMVDRGGIYKKEIPASDKEIVTNVWRFSEDLLWKKKASPDGTVDNQDTTKFDEFLNGNLDIGKRLPEDKRTGWYCIENAYFLASLLRELGYKVQYKNTIPSLGRNNFDTQTAAVNVWFDGGWHFFDPWESFDNKDDYINKRGNAAGPYHDYKMFKRTEPLTKPFGPQNDWWARTAKGGDGRLFRPGGWDPEKENKNASMTARDDPAFRIRLRDQAGRVTGWPGVPTEFASDAPVLAEIPLSSYAAPDTLVGEGMDLASVVPLAPRADELLFWGFDNVVTETRNYTLFVINPTSAPVSYLIDLEINDTDRTISVLDPGSSGIAGTLAPLETREIPLVVQIGTPRPATPEPVQDMRIVRGGASVVITWSESAGADAYRVYRCNTLTAPLTLAELSACSVAASSVTGTTFSEPPALPDDYFYAVTAVNAAGESELDSGENSVEVAAVERCDVDGNGQVDIKDINAIFAARNTTAGPGDSRNADCDSQITVNDARICALRCAKPKCAP